jgi:hypothetical protein
MSPTDRWTEQAEGLTWRDVVRWSHRDLCRLGIDYLNLLACQGLPETERLDIPLCLAKIDEWTHSVKMYTAQNADAFRDRPEDFGHSIGYFRALCLVTALQLECGVKYHPEKKDPAAVFEPADSFIFGIIQGGGGTCASLPVIYCAVGHGLGYPMFLAGTKCHGYVIWDDGEVRFNIEGSGEGMCTRDDDHYRTGRFEMSANEKANGYYLKPLDMRQSFAKFLAERSLYCSERRQFKEAVDSMGWAAALFPESKILLPTAERAYNEWLRESNRKKPVGFPTIEIVELKARRFAPTVPLEFELELCGLEAQECLLNDPELDSMYWNRLRRGERPDRLPVRVEVAVDGDCGKRIHFAY